MLYAAIFFCQYKLDTIIFWYVMMRELALLGVISLWVVKKIIK